MANFSITKDGASINLNQALRIKGDRSTAQTLVVIHAEGAAAFGKVVVIETSGPMMIDAVEGALDENGRFTFVVGPSFHAKGDGTITVKVGNKKSSFAVRFF